MWCRVRALLIWTSVVEDPWSLILRGLFLWYNLASSTCEPLLREAELLCDLSHGSASLAMGSYEAQTEFLWCQTTELMPGLVGPEWRYVIFCFSPHWLWKLPTNVAYLLSCMTVNKCTSAALPSKILSLAVPFWFLWRSRCSFPCPFLLVLGKWRRKKELGKMLRLGFLWVCKKCWWMVAVFWRPLFLFQNKIVQCAIFIVPVSLCHAVFPGTQRLFGRYFLSLKLCHFSLWRRGFTIPAYPRREEWVH